MYRYTRISRPCPWLYGMMCTGIQESPAPVLDYAVWCVQVYKNLPPLSLTIWYDVYRYTRISRPCPWLWCVQVYKNILPLSLTIRYDVGLLWLRRTISVLSAVIYWAIRRTSFGARERERATHHKHFSQKLFSRYGGGAVVERAPQLSGGYNQLLL